MLPSNGWPMTGLTIGEYRTADIFKPGAGNFLQTYGPPNGQDDQQRIQRAKDRATSSISSAAGGGRRKADPGWNVPIWHYEPVPAARPRWARPP